MKERVEHSKYDEDEYESAAHMAVRPGTHISPGPCSWQYIGDLSRIKDEQEYSTRRTYARQTSIDGDLARTTPIVQDPASPCADKLGPASLACGSELVSKKKELE